MLTLSELAANARHIINATELPVLCDADTGHGNVTNVRRTIREFESAGAAGVHLEDQTFPKRCGQTDGASCIPTAEMLAKIHAAKEAQRSDEFVLLVRTDARQCEGLDAIFPEALLSAEEFRRVRAEIDAPLVIDVPEWGRSPTMTIDELEDWEFDLAIFAISTLRIALGSVRRFLAGLMDARTQTAWLDDMMTRAEMDDLLGLTAIRDEEERLGATLRGVVHRSGHTQLTHGPRKPGRLRSVARATGAYRFGCWRRVDPVGAEGGGEAAQVRD